MSINGRWHMSFPVAPEDKVAVVLHRRLPNRIEVKKGIGSSTEAAIVAAMGRPLGFATAPDELAAVRAAFDGREVRLSVSDRLMSTFELFYLSY